MINTEKNTSAGFPEPEENKMTTEEMIHKIMDKTGVTKEQAAEALDKNAGDLLDAMIYVERTYGKASQAQNVQNVQNVQNAQAEQAAPNPQHAQAQSGAYTPPYSTSQQPQFDFSAAAKKAGNVLIDNSFVVFCKGKEIVELPLIVLLAAIILSFNLVLPAAIIAMFFDVTYRFKGPQLGKGRFNFVLDAISGMVRSIKASFSDVN